MIDDLAVTASDGDDGGPAAGVATFEAFSPDAYSTVTDAGATFAGRTGTGAATGVDVLGPPQGFGSNALSTPEWGESIIFARGGQAFDLASLALAAGRWGEAGDAVITGYAADGTVAGSVSAAFDSKVFSTVQLGFDGVVAVEVAFGGGANETYGAIDDVTFA